MSIRERMEVGQKNCPSPKKREKSDQAGRRAAKTGKAGEKGDRPHMGLRLQGHGSPVMALRLATAASLGTCEKYRFWDPTLALLTQKL